MSDIPQWAFERINVLANVQKEMDVSLMGLGLGIASRHQVAFAKYISEHEEAPVDPLLLEARKICAERLEGSLAAANFSAGILDDQMTIQCVIAALKSREVQS